MWDANKRPISVSDLRQLTTRGCLFARYILGKLEGSQIRGTLSNDLEQSLIIRYPPDNYEEYSDSLVVGIAGEDSSWVKLSLIAQAGKYMYILTTEWNTGRIVYIGQMYALL
jgi:hypothetical protein